MASLARSASPKATSPVDPSTGSSHTPSGANKATNANPIKYEMLSSKQKADLVAILQGNLTKAECRKYQDYFTVAGKLRAQLRPVFDEKDKDGKPLISQAVMKMHSCPPAKGGDRGKSPIDDDDASPKDGTPARDGAPAKDGASAKDKASVKDRASVKDKAPTEKEAPHKSNDIPAEKEVATEIESEPPAANKTLTQGEAPVEDRSNADISDMELEPRVTEPHTMDIDEDAMFDRMEPWYDPIGSTYSPHINGPLRVEPSTSAAGQAINPHAHPVRDSTISIDQILLNAVPPGQFDISLRSDESFIRILRRLDDEFRTIHHNMMTATSAGNLNQQIAHEHLRTVLDMRERIWSSLGRAISRRTASQRESLMTEYENSGPENLI